MLSSAPTNRAGEPCRASSSLSKRVCDGDDERDIESAAASSRLIPMRISIPIPIGTSEGTALAPRHMPYTHG